MTKYAYVFLGIVLGMIAATMIFKIIPNQESFSQKQETTYMEIPSWVKQSAGWWSQDRIGSDEFTSAIQYLIDHKIIKYKE